MTKFVIEDLASTIMPIPNLINSKILTMPNNVFRCLNCGYFVIAEEKNEHVCRTMKEYKVEGKIFKAFDGYLWYPLKLEEVDPTEFDREKYRRRLDRTPFQRRSGISGVTLTRLHQTLGDRPFSGT